MANVRLIQTGLRRFARLLLLLCVAFSESSGQTIIPMGPQISTYTGAVRGYYFIAPVNFTICQLYVEDDMNTQMQHVEVVRLNAVPPVYPSTTNAFTSLFYQNNYVPNAPIPCNIPITAGQIIGVYGARGNGTTMYNSYGPSPWTTSVFGNNFDCFYSGMQFPLSNQQMHDIWYANFNRTGRVTMYHDCTVLDGNLLDFVAVASGNEALLSWVVAADADVQEFEVERSREGEDFSAVANVPFRQSNAENVDFQHVDPGMGGRTSFYRLRMIGQNGESSYSEVKRVDPAGFATAAYSIYPNPMEVGTQFRLQVRQPSEDPIDLRVLDLRGREVFAAELPHTGGTGEYLVAPGRLAAGIYLLKLRQGERTVVERLVVR